MRKLLLLLAVCLISGKICAQGEVHGNFQSDITYYQDDSIIGSPIVEDKLRSNSFLNIIYNNPNGFYAGIRYEAYLNPLLGFDTRWQGNGIPHRYAGYSNDDFDVTVGNIYEQFGSGMIFRTYEAQSLGIDNSIDGLRVKYRATKGLYLKGIVGRQRNYFGYGPGLIRGGDAELSLNEALPFMADKKLKITTGGSIISRYQDDDNPFYRLPENVSAMAGRINLQRGYYNLSYEYAYKINDPSADNNLSYRSGNGIMLNASYAQKGFGVSVGAKRIDNMSFRSDRNASINDLTLSFLPAITKQHAYLLSSYYPYATQPNGEMGIQADVFINFKKGSILGGKYGTKLAVNYSEIYGLDTGIITDSKFGYEIKSNNVGDLYYRDFNVELTKKLSSNWKTTLTYMLQLYNKDVVQGLSNFGTIKSHIYVAELSYKINSKNNVRTELQLLNTKQDFGSWAAALVEYTIAPKYFIALFDQYNYGNSDPSKQVHYFTGQVGFLTNTLRTALNYGRQREGIVCVGGVCRNVPASKGFTVSITKSF
jgi:hypothetical protein